MRRTIKHNIKGTIDCQIQQIRDVANTAGLEMSSPLCFGLSEGLGAMLETVHLAEYPYLVIIGRNTDNFECFLNRFEFPFSRQCIEGGEAFRQVVDDSGINNQLVVAYVDRFYLEYTNNHYSKTKQEFVSQHFGSHILGVESYDRQNDSYRLLDMFSSDPEIVKACEFDEARMSDWDVHPPDNQCFVIDLEPKHITNDRMRLYLADAIASNMDRMLNDEKGGIAAIESLARQIAALQKVDLNRHEKVLVFQFGVFSFLVSDFESSHSFYRLVYRDFIHECVTRYGMSELTPFEQEFASLGQRWNEVGRLMGEDIPTAVSCVPKKLSELAIDERKVTSRLLDCANCLRRSVPGQQ